jgi:hypothetical protein
MYVSAGEFEEFGGIVIWLDRCRQSFVGTDGRGR